MCSLSRSWLRVLDDQGGRCLEVDRTNDAADDRRQSSEAVPDVNGGGAAQSVRRARAAIRRGVRDVDICRRVDAKTGRLVSRALRPDRDPARDRLIDDRDARSFARCVGQRVVRVDRATEVEDPHEQQEQDRDDERELDEGLPFLTKASHLVFTALFTSFVSLPPALVTTKVTS